MPNSPRKPSPALDTPAHLTPDSIKFLRGLRRHNDRNWFEARRAVYERHIKDPLHAVVSEINTELADFASEYVRPPHKVAMRIYRDTRFSPDKRPYKTHVSAWWARVGLEKTAAPGFFLQVGPEGGFVAAGIYAPEREDLLKVRNWLAEHHERYRATMSSLTQTRQGELAFVALEPNALTRNPKGFAADHPASDLLRARNWGLTLPFAVSEALEPGFAGRVAGHFRRMAPLVALLTQPFEGTRQRASQGLEKHWF